MAEVAMTTTGVSIPTVSVQRDPQKNTHGPIFQSSVTYYKMQAPCSSSPSGYISWVNTTGDLDGKPACGGTEGAAEVVDSWSG